MKSELTSISYYFQTKLFFLWISMIQDKITFLEIWFYHVEI